MHDLLGGSVLKKNMTVLVFLVNYKKKFFLNSSVLPTLFIKKKLFYLLCLPLLAISLRKSFLRFFGRLFILFGFTAISVWSLG